MHQAFISTSLYLLICCLLDQVLSFAQQQFLQEIAKDDACINLAKTCLVIALEEEAAAQVESLSPNDRSVLARSHSDHAL
jgi:hypothetical protein